MTFRITALLLSVVSPFLLYADPVAVNDTIYVTEDQGQIDFNVGLNDINTDDTTLVFSFLQIEGLAYMNYFNSDGFTNLYIGGNVNQVTESVLTYKVCNGFSSNECSVAQLIIITSPVNDPPQPALQTFMVCEDGFFSGDLMLITEDYEGDQIVLTSYNVSSGTVSFTPDGVVSYTPEPGFSGNVSVTYQVCDDVVPPACISYSYTCVVRDKNLQLVQTNINPPPCIGMTTGTIYFQFSGGISPFVYEWSDGGNFGPTRVNVGAGTYSVLVTDQSGCAIPQVFSFDVNAPQVIDAEINLGPGDCANQTREVQIIASGGDFPYTYLWSTGAEGVLTTLPVPGTHSVVITDTDGCRNELQVFIEDDCELSQLWFPRGFSPDLDGINDRWEIAGLTESLIGEIVVYDEGGARVYQHQHYDNSWDGTDERTGVRCAEGTYFYEINFPAQGKSFSGFIVIQYQP